MKKSLLLSAISVAGAAALVGGMTFASFNDYEDPNGPCSWQRGRSSSTSRASPTR